MAGEYMDSDSCYEAIRNGDSIKKRKFNLFRNERDIVKYAMDMNGGHEFEHASKELRADRQLCAQAISERAGLFQRGIRCDNNGINLQYASNELKADKSLFETAMSNCPNHSSYAFGLHKFPKNIREDKDLMLTFHNKHGNCLAFVGQKLQDDKEFVHHVLQSEGWQLEHASERLRDDKEVVLLALCQSDSGYKACSERLKADHEVCLASIELAPYNEKYFPKEVRQLIGTGDPKTVLTKAIAVEKLHAKLNKTVRDKGPEQVAKRKL